MKKYGFTLVELMGVLVIIGLLSLILIPVTSNLLKKQTEEQYEQQIVNIELAAKNFGSDNLVILPNKDEEYMNITIGQLKAMGYIDEEIVNPVSNKTISDCAQVKITKNGRNYTYEYDRSTEEYENCNLGNSEIIISSPVDQYIKNNETTSYLLTINDNTDGDITNKYEIKKEKISLTGNTDAIYTVVEGNGIYRVIIKGGSVEGRVGLKLESGAFLKNEIEDLVGNEGLESSEKVIVDNTIPTITFGTNGNNNWAKRATSTISVNDNLSGGDSETYKYLYSNSQEASPTRNFTNGSSYSYNNATGNYFLIASACDRAGNCTTETSNVFKLDNEPPTTPTIITSNYTEDSWTNNSVMMKYFSTDSKVGGVYYQYSHSGIFSDTSSNIRNSATWNISSTGYYIYYIRACDALENCSDADSIKIKIDKDNPTITSATTSACSSNKRTITVNASDPNSGSTLNSANVGSGIGGYAITSSPTKPSSSSFDSVTNSSWTSSSYSPGTYYVWVKDNAGNISSYTTVTVPACDTEGPVIVFETNGSSSYVAQASTLLEVTDNSEISSISYGWSTSNTSISTPSTTTSGAKLSSKCDRTTDGECYLYVKACDVHGNCSERRTAAFNLDVTAPTITITKYSACATGLYESYTMSDSGSGVAQYGKIHCDLNLGSDSCYGYITGSRIKTITATPSKSINSEWTTCNTSGDEQPTGTHGCAFWVKAYDAVGNMSKKNTTQNLKAFSSTVACPGCP